jgi:hypothetical protein
MEHTGRATVVQHCAVFGPLETPVRWVQTHEVRPYAQHPVAVYVTYIAPGKRTESYITIVPDNIRYCTIQAGGRVVWDSREEVPCDMVHWEQTYQRRLTEGARAAQKGAR